MATLLVACRQSLTDDGPKPPIELLIHGQSNGVSPANGSVPRVPRSARVWVSDYYCEVPDGVKRCSMGTDMVQPSPAASIRSNQAWIVLADELSAMTGREVRIYNVAQGGSATAYLASEAQLVPARAAVRDHPNLCAVLWIQGESESNVPVEQTVANMQTIITATRAEHPSLRWIVAPDSYARIAQMRLIEQGVVLRGPDIDSLRTNPLYFEEGYGEFIGSGIDAHARAWLTTVLAHCT